MRLDSFLKTVAETWDRFTRLGPLFFRKPGLESWIFDQAVPGNPLVLGPTVRRAACDRNVHGCAVWLFKEENRTLDAQPVGKLAGGFALFPSHAASSVIELVEELVDAFQSDFTLFTRK